MDPARFYGTAKHVNTIPGDVNVSDDNFDPKRNIIILESESDFSEE